MRSIRREHVEAFMVAELERTSPSSAATRYRSLQQLFKWLDNEGEIDASPMAKIRPPKIPEKPVPVLSDDHVRLLLADCSGKDFRNRRDCAIIQLFLDTGMRLEGLSGLMEARTSINLTASLHSTAADLSEVASDLAHLHTDEGIEQQARVLDRIAENSTEGATILRAQIARRKHALGTLPHSDTPRRQKRVRNSPRSGWQRIVIAEETVIEDLELLRREWGHAYLIWVQAGQYCARRRDNAAICRRRKAGVPRDVVDDAVAASRRQEMPALEMPYGQFRPVSGGRDCLNGWRAAGGPHHEVMNLGHHSAAWRDFRRLAGIELVQV